MRRRNETVGAARSGFFGAQSGGGVGSGNGFLAADLAQHRLISAAAIAWTANEPTASAIPARAALIP
jgi:hypothetical protein